MIDDLHAELERIIKRDGHGKTWILCGSEDADNNDRVIDHIIKKPIGFDEGNSFYYALCTQEAGKGCMKHTREKSR